MGRKGLFTKSESLISVDIGSTSVKLIELDLSFEKPKLLNIGISPLPGDVFSSNALSKVEKVSEQIASLLEANGIVGKRVVTAMPAPSVFTKRIKMPKTDMDELATNIQFEAGNFIPHNVDAVKLDFHVLGQSGKNQLDVLVVAVKNEIIDSFMECLSLAGLETAVVDVDYFALQNMFEITYPEFASKTVALINMGARYSSINICRNGESLFTGDVAVGGKLFTDGIADGLGVSAEEAERYKKAKEAHPAVKDALNDILDRNIENVASELNRQLSFFWNASGSDEGIDRIMLSGGGALIPGLLEELGEKTGIECSFLEPLRGLDCGGSFDAAYLKEIGPLVAIPVGMGIREPGDKIIPEFDE